MRAQAEGEDAAVPEAAAAPEPAKKEKPKTLREMARIFSELAALHDLIDLFQRFQTSHSNENSIATSASIQPRRSLRKFLGNGGSKQ